MPEESHEDAAKKFPDAGLTWSTSGFELDITSRFCLDDDIKTNSDEAGMRDDGAEMGKDGTGNVDVRKTSHWDITFFR